MILGVWLVFLCALGASFFLGSYFRRMWLKAELSSRAVRFLTISYWLVAGLLSLGLLGAAASI